MVKVAAKVWVNVVAEMAETGPRPSAAAAAAATTAVAAAVDDRAIGDKAAAATRATPEADAKVRAVVGVAARAIGDSS